MLDVQEGHYLLNEVEYFNYLYQKGLITKEDKEEEIRDCVVNFKVCNGLIVRYPLYSKLDSTEEFNVDKHDNYFAYCCDRQSAKDTITYGLKHFFHYDARPFKLVVERHGFIGAIKQWIACTRQPYQLGAYALMGYGICDPVSYLHLLITTIIEPFKEGTSGKKLLYLFSCNTRTLGKPISFIFNILMKIKHGSNWIDNMYKEYYGNTFPDLIYVITEKKYE